MKRFVKLNSLKLICPIFLVAYSGFVYSTTKTFDLSDYNKDFWAWNNDSVPYLQDRTITVDMEYRVKSVDNALRLGIKNKDGRIRTGRVESYKTTTNFLDGNGKKGRIEAKLAFQCDGQDNLNSYKCEHVWPAFWLWRGPYGEQSAEIDIAEFQVQNGGYVSHSNHVYTIGGSGRHQLLAGPIDYPTRNGSVKYGLEWDCHGTYQDAYKYCNVKFLEDGNIAKTHTFYAENKHDLKIIKGFKDGYQIIFTQHYFSEDPKHINYYDKFNGHSSEMIVKSLTITNEF